MAFSPIFSYLPAPGRGAGSDVYGYKLGQLGYPSPAANLEAVTPGYQNLISSATGNIGSELKGQLPSDVVQSIIDADAAKAVSGGYSGSGLAHNLTARDLGLTSLGLMNTGMGNLLNFLPVQSKTATLDPALAAEISNLNLQNAAAPNPQARGLHEEQLFSQGAAGQRLSGTTSITAPPPAPVSPMSPMANQYMAPVSSGGGSLYGSSSFYDPTMSSYSPLINQMSAIPSPTAYFQNDYSSSPSSAFYGSTDYSTPYKYNYPSNFSDLSSSQQSDYVDQLINAAGIDASIYQ